MLCDIFVSSCVLGICRFLHQKTFKEYKMGLVAYSKLKALKLTDSVTVVGCMQWHAEGCF